MHELPIINKVLSTALQHAEKQGAEKVLSVTLEAGETHDSIEPVVKKYFRFASKGTIAEDAELIYHALPIICRYNQCQENFVFHLKYGERTEVCPVCGSDSFELITGNELLVRHIVIC